MVENLQKDGPVFVVDGGDLFSETSLPQPDALERSRQVAHLLAQGTALPGIDAMVPGRADVALGWDFVVEVAGTYKLPYVASNLKCTGENPFPTFRKVEHGGITLGFVGALSAQSVVPDCEVTDPVESATAAIATMGPVDNVVALGAFENEVAKALIAANPGVGFVVSSSPVTLTEPRSIGDGHFLLGNGPKGKKVGVLKATLVTGAQGWRAANPGTELNERLDRYKKRLDDANKRAEKAGDNEKAKTQADRQVGFYQSEIEKVEKEIAEANAPSSVPTHLFENTLTDLSSSVADHPATLALVDKAKQTLPPEPVPQRPGILKMERGANDAPMPMRGMVQKPVQLPASGGGEAESKE